MLVSGCRSSNVERIARRPELILGLRPSASGDPGDLVSQGARRAGRAAPFVDWNQDGKRVGEGHDSRAELEKKPAEALDGQRFDQLKRRDDRPYERH